jgi:hypothetical protein
LAPIFKEKIDFWRHFLKKKLIHLRRNPRNRACLKTSRLQKKKISASNYFVFFSPKKWYYRAEVVQVKKVNLENEKIFLCVPNKKNSENRQIVFISCGFSEMS